MHHIKLFIILLMFLLTGFMTASGQTRQRPDFLSDDVRYLWPTNASTYMSATFGETRSAHFHSAIDIGTWGREGFDVYASRDGVLARVAVSPYGYGNVIYLRHSDGSYTVYAHLQDFEPKIRSIVDSIRIRDFNPDFDRNMERFAIRYKQGDKIGRTGSTGIGPPHLHFELRSPANSPFNPMLAGITVPDNIPPRFSGLAVEPLSPEAMIEGRRGIYTTSPKINNGIYDFGTITVNGDVGLAVDVSDRADNANNVYAVYELELFVGDERYFHSRVDSFSFGSVGQMFLDRVYPLLKSTGRGFQRLFVRNGNRLPFYITNESNGEIRLPAGSYPFRVVARDFAGNESEARGMLEVSSYPPETGPVRLKNSFIPPPPVIALNGDVRDFSRWHWSSNWLTAGNDNRPLEVTMLHNNSNGARKYILNQGNPGSWIPLDIGKSAIFSTSEGHTYQLNRLHPRTVNAISTFDQKAWARFGEASLFDSMSAGISHRITTNGIAAVSVMPDTEPLQAGFTLSYSMNNIPEAMMDKMGFYTHNGRRDTYSYLRTERNGSVLSANPRQMGTFYILPDTTSPAVSQPRIYRRADGKWLATVHVKDDLSGIDYRNVVFTVNGVRGIAEFDPFGGMLIYHHPEFVPKRVNILRVDVPDAFSNLTRVEFTVNN
jgi:hypothetical protein